MLFVLLHMQLAVQVALLLQDPAYGYESGRQTGACDSNSQRAGAVEGGTPQQDRTTPNLRV
jgi:hypothetical protein